MPALVAGIHVLLFSPSFKDVDGRDKPGHDEYFFNYFTTAAVWPNSSLRSSSVRIAGWP
jgi:hypothetical protein